MFLLALSLNSEDLMGSHVEDIKTVKYTRIRPSGEMYYAVADSYVNSQIEQMFSFVALDMKILTTSILDNEQCLVEGSFKANTVPGKFYFSYRSSMKMLNALIALNSELYSKINFDHHIERLSFGSEYSIQLIQEYFPTKALDFDKLNDFSYHEIKGPTRKFQYFIKLFNHRLRETTKSKS